LKKVATVEEFLRDLKHSRKPEIETLRRIILSASPSLTEHVKWNAPSYCVDGDDRLTLRLQPRDQLQVILHRGAKPKDASNFNFADDTGLVKWLAKDRGVVTFDSSDDLREKKPALTRLIQRWVEAT